MKIVLIENFGLIHQDDEWQVVKNCTVCTDDEVQVLIFNSEEQLQTYINDNNIIIDNNSISDIPTVSGV